MIKRKLYAETGYGTMDDGKRVRPAVSFSLKESILDSEEHLKLFPVMEIGQDHLAFLTELPVRIHSRISLLYYCKPDSEIPITLEGRVISCNPVSAPSPYRFCVYVLFNPIFQNRKFPFADMERPIPVFTGHLQFAA